MKVFGLTGSAGMGKSAATEALRRRAVPVVDTDVLARQVVEPGQPALREIQEAFGSKVVGPDGRLRREELASLVFPNPDARRRLEQITHPRIRELWRRQLADWRAEGRSHAVVVIPLLFETGAEAELDAVICVACSVATQKRRLQERGWTAQQIEQRLAAQWPIEKKILAANYVVWNEGALEVLEAQLERIISKAEG